MREITNKIILNFIKNFIQIFKLKKILFLNYSNFTIFEGLSNHISKTLSPGQSDFQDKDKFDLIIGNLPIGMKNKEWLDRDRNIDIKARQNWIDLFKSLFLLDNSGYGIYVVEPNQQSEEWLRFIRNLNSKGFFINGIINTPKEILSPQTSLRPNLIIISRFNNPYLFIAEPEDVEGIESLVGNFKNLYNSGSLDNGVLIKEKDFKGFSQYKIINQINALEMQYKNYRKYQLKDIASDIVLGNTKRNFEDKPNSIYLPKVGTSPVVSKLNKLNIKQQNYFQVVLDDKIVKNEYLEIFFRSALGKYIIKTLFTGGIIPHINKTSLLSAYALIPDFKEQEFLITTTIKLSKLKEHIELFNEELALNPNSAKSIQDKLNNLLFALDELSETEKIRAIIRTGESKTIEFKQTFSVDIKTGKKEKYIEKAVMKTLVAFLNTSGGTLLVGVSDNKEIIGIQEEITKIYKNKDKLYLHIKNIIKSSIGEKFYNNINYDLVDVETKKILCFDCGVSNEPCFYESKEFFVRTKPATDKLEGQQMYDYIKNHFGK
ncbi:MAG: putative DNA binding domain-containing protein [Candidatus Delongbacteria bacterium]|nr:putative DNA binding domain-containing protein [Candidatus Delongbacteria bacterium]